MARIDFTPNLARYVDTDRLTADGRTVGELFDNVFAERVQLKGYILDDQGALRKHVNVFVDNRMIVDRIGLTDAVTNDSKVFVMQALSGG
ncbi:MAG: MoaD/ThiS family protein [Gammaproteobacteria bacterium]|nr:MoaD/ThiS family protein [Gammaproteobacteria bacterium]